MHTLTIIAGGLLLLGVFLGVGRLLQLPMSRTALSFIPVWLAGALINMWVGVARAGYTVAQEAPITLVVFAVPAVVAWLIARRQG